MAQIEAADDLIGDGRTDDGEPERDEHAQPQPGQDEQVLQPARRGSCRGPACGPTPR